MSAWLCNEAHIFEIAHYFVDNCQKYVQPVNKKTYRETAEILWKANNDSLVARYDDEFIPMVIPVKYAPMVTNIHHMAKLVDCYMYQSSEFEEWEQSFAYTICENVKDGLLSNSDDYEEAPWGFDPDEYHIKFIDNAKHSIIA